MSSKDKAKSKSKEHKDSEKPKDTSKEHIKDPKESKGVKKDNLNKKPHEISQSKIILEDKDGIHNIYLKVFYIIFFTNKIIRVIYQQPHL